MENSLKDKIKVHANSLVIVEVKNNDNYHDMSLNLERKKNLLKSIGFPVEKIYFVGILRNLDEIRNTLGQLKILKQNNMIIIYPDKSTFLNIPLFDKTIEKKVEEEKKEKLEDKMEKLFDLIGELTTEINEMDGKINNINAEMKDMKTEMENMRTDIDILKNKIN